MSALAVFRSSRVLLAKKGRKGFGPITFVPMPQYGQEERTPPPDSDPTTGWQQNKSRRCGLLAKKLGMSMIFDEWGGVHAVTALQVK